MKHPAESVAVIGAGMVGLALAWRLGQAGWKVTVFDAGRAASEASWAGAGMLAPGGEVFADGPHTRMILAARDGYAGFVRELEAESGQAIDFQQAGALDLAYSDAEWQELQERGNDQRAFGLDSKVLSADRVRAFWPHICRDGLTGALFYPEDRLVNPREVNAALLTVLRQRGIEIREATPVGEMHVAAETLILEPGGRFERAVITAGAWSQQIKVTGAAAIPPLPKVEPVHGMLLGYRQPKQTCQTIVRRGSTYIFQRANGLLVVGASSERLGFSHAIEPQTQADLEQQASQIFPHLGETNPNEVWTGLRPYSDELQVGRWHSDRLYLAYGHYRNGILLAPHTAALVAAQIATD